MSAHGGGGGGGGVILVSSGPIYGWNERDPVTRPSGMAMRGMSPEPERRVSWREMAAWASLPWLLAGAILGATLALAGCATSAAKSEAEVIREMDALLANPCPEDVRWRADVALAREDAKRVLPAPSPSPTPGAR